MASHGAAGGEGCTTSAPLGRTATVFDAAALVGARRHRPREPGRRPRRERQRRFVAPAAAPAPSRPASSVLRNPGLEADQHKDGDEDRPDRETPHETVQIRTRSRGGLDERRLRPLNARRQDAVQPGRNRRKLLRIATRGQRHGAAQIPATSSARICRCSDVYERKAAAAFAICALSIDPAEADGVRSELRAAAVLS